MLGIQSQHATPHYSTLFPLCACDFLCFHKAYGPGFICSSWSLLFSKFPIHSLFEIISCMYVSLCQHHFLLCAIKFFFICPYLPYKCINNGVKPPEPAQADLLWHKSNAPFAVRRAIQAVTVQLSYAICCCIVLLITNSAVPAEWLTPRRTRGRGFPFSQKDFTPLWDTRDQCFSPTR